MGKIKYILILLAATINFIMNYNYAEKLYYNDLKIKSEYIYDIIKIRSEMARETLDIMNQYAQDYQQYIVPKESSYLDEFVFISDNYFTLDDMKESEQASRSNITGYGNEEKLKEMSEELYFVETLEPYFETLYNSNMGIDSMYYMSKNNFAAIYPYVDSKDKDYNSKAANVWRNKNQMYTDRQQLTWSSVFYDVTSNRLTTAISTQVKDEQDEVIGEICVDMYMPNNLMEGANNGEYTYYVINQRFEILGSNDEAFTNQKMVKTIYDVFGTYKSSNFMQNIITKNNEGFSYRNKLLYVASDDKEALKVVVVAKTSDFLANSLLLSVIILFVGFALMLIVYEYEVLVVNKKEQIFIKENAQRKLDSLKYELETDLLTGLRNRRHMETHINNLIEYKQDFFIAIGDLDHFKIINDTYGHDVGDMVLVNTTEIFRHIVDEDIVVARWGGEEILVVVTDIDEDSMMELIEEVRLDIQVTDIKINEKDSINVTISFGIAEHINGTDIKKTISNADTALYNSKTNGRNRTTLYEDMYL